MLQAAVFWNDETYLHRSGAFFLPNYTLDGQIGADSLQLFRSSPTPGDLVLCTHECFVVSNCCLTPGRLRFELGSVKPVVALRINWFLYPPNAWELALGVETGQFIVQGVNRRKASNAAPLIKCFERTSKQVASDWVESGVETVDLTSGAVARNCGEKILLRSFELRLIEPHPLSQGFAIDEVHLFGENVALTKVEGETIAVGLSSVWQGVAVVFVMLLVTATLTRVLPKLRERWLRKSLSSQELRDDDDSEQLHCAKFSARWRAPFECVNCGGSLIKHLLQNPASIMPPSRFVTHYMHAHTYFILSSIHYIHVYTCVHRFVVLNSAVLFLIPAFLVGLAAMLVSLQCNKADVLPSQIVDVGTFEVPFPQDLIDSPSEESWLCVRCVR